MCAGLMFYCKMVVYGGLVHLPGRLGECPTPRHAVFTSDTVTLCGTLYVLWCMCGLYVAEVCIVLCRMYGKYAWLLQAINLNM